MTRPLVVERLPRRVPPPPSAPLPDAALSALASIADDMRHLPRECIHDPAELFHWLRRLAARVDGVSRIRVQQAALPRPSGPSRAPATCGAGSRGRVGASGAQKTGPARTARDLAAAVFGQPAPARQPPPARETAEAVVGKAGMPQPIRHPEPRTVVSRKGHKVRVEYRRAKAWGQGELAL